MSSTALGSTQEPDVTVASPCIGICILMRSGHCEGCGRHIDEISSWTSLSSNARQQIIDCSKRRLNAVRHHDGA